MNIKKLIFMTLSLGFISALEQDGFLAKEEVDNYTVYLMSRELVQSQTAFQNQCPGGFEKLRVLYVPKVAQEVAVDFSQIIGISQRSFNDAKANIHYVIINCLNKDVSTVS